jgi:hypothetical protein
MAIRIPSTRAGWLRLGLGLVAAIVAVLVGLSGMPASADRADLTLNWDGRHYRDWSGNPSAEPYYYGPHGYDRHRRAACGTNTVMGAAFGAGVGGLIGSQLSERPNDAGPTVFGMLVGAVIGGAIGQSADRANGC